MDFVNIQAQDETGNWRTYSVTQNNSLMITQGMQQLRWQFPNARIRAVDGNGRLLDML